MRAPVGNSGQDWFRIVNKKADDKETDLTEVYIYDEIGFWGTSASEFVRQVAAITSPKIDLHLNSPGGEIFDGVAIYNSLKSHHAEVTVYVDALAASAASFIAQAGDKVMIARNATMMIHDGIAFTYGNAKDHKDTAGLLDKLSDNIADIYTQRAGGELETWRNFMREEVWYNAQEAVDAGLADEIFEAKPSEDNVDRKFNLVQLFNYSSRKEAPSLDLVRERVFNRVKEARNMATPKNGHEDGTPEEPQSVPAGTEQEEQESNSPDGSQPGEPQQVGEVPVQPAPPAGGNESVNSASGQPTNIRVLINGIPTTDMQVIQNHINVLEGTIKESKTANRKAFIENLASTGKITAAQMNATENFVNLLDDQQYESWVASWDAAPSLPLLGDHAAPGHQSTPAVNKAENDNLETAKAIVMQHKIGGMPLDKIKETPSYKTVVAADPEFKL